MTDQQPLPPKSFDPGTFRDRPVSFVRRSGRMTPSQARAWEQHRADYVLDIPRGRAATSVADGVAGDPERIFGRSAPLVVEVGTGQGHAILHAAESRPDKNFLGVEVFRAGLARTIIRAELAGVKNLRLAEVNAPELLEKYLPAGSVDEIWVFFPDPWAKARHHKRRLVSADFARIAALALRPGGVLRLATDWEDYAERMREVLDAAPEFERDFEGEWAERFEGRVLTAFERKGAERGRAIRDLVYRRAQRPPIRPPESTVEA
ncbi:tRNA (guanosine(46)-N7)-methyltransferase TrmB [Leucobacter sp. wl10]|uniref:tRNA (guanosine(46)-N7)-methyltransferase TrmB n=1 Tax=Leucobacter sp. wl10 TaxID=2304677 RepID=UPI000E5BCE14|nr:tRNA (guanosine(46)-N7)-methyltransferase TrmB [Leucobacter sp. wl10]RGE21056.1 tRNA (guanosine(46)-N7)-methyltransferase TrmB [Leucobacter sp. wl10]